MARNYTLEDVEALKSKSGVSYEEAVALLDKYDGDVARALIELEKRGQLGGKDQTAGKYSLEDAWTWVYNMWMKGLNTRVQVERKGERLVSLPVLFLILMLILGPYAMIAAVVLMLLSGCSVSMQTEDGQKQTIHPEEEAADEEAGEKAAAADGQEAEEKPSDDDDFPSITIS